jgi:hypothetical protein
MQTVGHPRYMIKNVYKEKVLIFLDIYEVLPEADPVPSTECT